MAKFYGAIGFVNTVEKNPGVFVETPVEKNYYGDVTRNARRWESTETINDSVVVNNTISIVADNYAYENIGAMRYVKWSGVAWKISSIDIQHPRLVLTLGGIYNGDTAETS